MPDTPSFVCTRRQRPWSSTISGSYRTCVDYRAKEATRKAQKRHSHSTQFRRPSLSIRRTQSIARRSSSVTTSVSNEGPLACSTCRRLWISVRFRTCDDCRVRLASRLPSWFAIFGATACVTRPSL
ncbi:hypothetical protein CDEST_15357 [Colletotrichum destructivum]|uniref:Uncharacterized protein n=1 Tax=Colletotrichum destructivum TaxID=34406 RepID=A0AAX4J433_9PEZI|nr:hypothetical protein CDEST_15357 [Colletotrichum destructivum]